MVHRDLHSANNKIGAQTMMAENGRLVPSRLNTVNQHDIPTGSKPDGTEFGPDASKSWNSSHPSRACDAPSLVATGGAGLLYCFAAD